MKLPPRLALYNFKGWTLKDGGKQYDYHVEWIKDEKAFIAERNTKHQDHGIQVYFEEAPMSEAPTGYPRKKMTLKVLFHEKDHPTGYEKERDIDIFTLVHLMMNITDEEIAEIANRPPVTHTSTDAGTS